VRVPEEAAQHGHEVREEGGHHHGPADAHRPGHEHQGAHESPPVMTVPLIVLAVFAVGVGAVLGPLAPGAMQFSHFLESDRRLFPHGEEPGTLAWLMALSILLALGGVALAWLMYVRQPDLPGKLARSARGLYQLSLNKFHWDELYASLILAPLRGVALFSRIFDQYVVDGIVDLIGHVPRLVGALFRPVQNGLVQFYALAMVLGLTVFLLALVRSL
jgi:NADH-quinone oxidoreductase subunit L